MRDLTSRESTQIVGSLETDFAAALEPLVLELEVLRAELAALKAAPRVAAGDLEPLVLELAAARAELAILKAHRLDAPAWAAGVYRQGTVVQHFHGQYFEATADTAVEPGDGVAWRRLGTHGFRYRGLFCDGVEYETGDLVGRDGSMMLQTAGALTWLALRGKDGRRGPAGQDGKDGQPGQPGEAGRRGADGASLVKLEVSDGLIWAVSSDGKRSPMALEKTDGAPA